MTDRIDGISNPSVQPPSCEPDKPTRAAPRLATGETSAPQDAVELSEAAQKHAAGDIRQDLVNRVRAEIAKDEYLSDEKLNTAADRLLQDILSRKSSA